MKKTLMKALLLSLCAGTLVTASSQVLYAEESTSEENQSEQVSEETAESEETTESEETADSPEAAIVSERQVQLEKAITLFQEEYPDAKISKLNVELEKDDTYSYEVKGFDETQEYKLTVDEEGKPTEQKEETDDQDDQDDVNENVELDLANLLTLDEASKLAKEESGLEDIVEWTLETDDDDPEQIPYWAVKYKSAEEDLEVYIDATNGDIIKVEKDD